ncbi:delta-aminolevulinic acid dehydratase [bacterium]|nr:delta-aminolevulinic acid dehydratase [bacterium]
MKIKAFNNLISYCEKEKLKGWDPYDGLNSWVIQKTLLGRSRFFRLAWTQLFKLNPINLRPLFGIKKEYNPKGLGLFLIGYCNLYTKTNKKEYLDKIRFISNEILQLQTKGYSGACWGYNFDWQARAFFQPKYTPTVVATSFIVEALFQAYKITRDIKLIETASSASHFILKDLNKTHDEQGNYTLSYSPLDKTQVFNAGLLGAKTLALIYEHTNEDYLLNEAKKIVDYVCSKQNPDGSWAYGTLPFHQWADSFHTGYNLECIYIYQKISGDLIYQKNIDKGLDYYLNNFFTEEGMSKYYNNKTYPIDIHAPAQLVVTLAKMQKLNEHRPLVDKVLLWTIDNMQSSKGFFYYQKGKTVTTRISYIRWAQSWMFYALSYYEIKIS